MMNRRSAIGYIASALSFLSFMPRKAAIADPAPQWFNLPALDHVRQVITLPSGETVTRVNFYERSDTLSVIAGAKIKSGQFVFRGDDGKAYPFKAQA